MVAQAAEVTVLLLIAQHKLVDLEQQTLDLVVLVWVVATLLSLRHQAQVVQVL